MTRSKKLLILLIALCAVSALFFAVTKISDSYNASVTDETKVIFSMDSEEDATALSWTYEDETSSFIKNGDVWEYSEDRAFPVDEDALDALLSNFLEVSSTKTIESPEDVSQYGLESPSLSVSVTTDSETTFDFGITTGITGEYYCSIGDGNVYLVSTDTADSFQTDAYSLIKKEDIPDMSDINNISVVNDEGEYYFEHIENAGITYSDEYVWYYVNDGKYTALDNQLFESYLSSVKGVSFAECVNYNANEDDLEKYGLSVPAVTIKVNYTRTEEVETDEVDEDGNVIYETNEYIEDFELELGDYDSDYCYARIKGSNMIYYVDASVEDEYLYTSVEDMLPDDVINLDLNELTEFEASIKGETYKFTKETIETRDDDTEDVSEKEVYMYNGEEIGIEDELSSLNSLSSTGKAQNSADGKDPVYSFTFYRDNEKYPVTTLEFYLYDSSTYFTVLDGETTVLADSSSVDAIADNIIELLFPEEDESSEANE